MELEWEFEKPMQLADIRNELKNTMTNMFKGEFESYCESIISKYSIVYEITTFIFETYRSEFEANIKREFHYAVNEDYLELKRKSFIMSIALEVLVSIGRRNLHMINAQDESVNMEING